MMIIILEEYVKTNPVTERTIRVLKYEKIKKVIVRTFNILKIALTFLVDVDSFKNNWANINTNKMLSDAKIKGVWFDHLGKFGQRYWKDKPSIEKRNRK